MNITASNIIRLINQLPRNIRYNYVNPKNRNTIEIVNIVFPEGPISIKRSNSSEIQTISKNMIWRLANSVEEGIPVNMERVFGASYNTRSVLEALLAHTPEFYWCRPGRIELPHSPQEIKEGHKHLIWLPNQRHENATPQEYHTDIVISEIPSSLVVYDALKISSHPEIKDINITRRHLQIQVALASIGYQLGFRTWIARNVQGFSYGHKKIGQLDGVINRLEQEKLMTVTEGSLPAALHIDCIWFRNGRFIPAVIEVEHSTGITSGLTRMSNLFDQIPPYPIRWVIAAPDEDRHKVIELANRPQFRKLKTKFLPYSSIDELYALCKKRKLNGNAVNEAFLDCFMENCL